MKTWERQLFTATLLMTLATGLAYLWMKYFLTSDDPFALVNHPWQSAVLGAHVLLAPLLVLGFGIVLNSHVMKKLRANGSPNRRTGYVSLGAFALMSASGYLLQVMTSDGVLGALVVVHVASSIAFTLMYGVHLFISWRMGRARTVTSLARMA